jgi:hypothetical protein
MFSWYAGSLEADVYFCPERHGTYFGSFYLKDGPAIGNPNYTIDETITGNMGANFLSTLNDSQKLIITSLVSIQKPALLNIVNTRQDIAVQLRRFIAGETPDQAAVLALAMKYGQLDGELVYNYATAFVEVSQTLSANQQASLMALRTQLLGNLSPSGAFLYSEPIPMPEIPDSDFLFGIQQPDNPPVSDCNTVTVNLEAGWNLFSVPWYVAGSGVAPDIFFASLGSNLNAVYAYDNCTSNWSSWNKVTGGSLTMDDGKGYWVSITSPAQITLIGTLNSTNPLDPLPQYTVCPGWNLIGFKNGCDSAAIRDYLDPPLNVASIYTFDDGAWKVPANLNPGLAYWVALTDGGTIYP